MRKTNELYIKVALLATLVILPAIIVPMHISGAPFQAYFSLLPTLSLGLMWGVVAHVVFFKKYL